MKPKIRETKKRLISLAIACYPGLTPIEIAEKAIQSLEEFDKKLNELRI